MVQLARRLGTGPASLAEIAAEEDLPRAYLEQLVMSLRDAGLVTSTRGAHGGDELPRAPRGIPVSGNLPPPQGPPPPQLCAPPHPPHPPLPHPRPRRPPQRPWGPRRRPGP